MEQRAIKLALKYANPTDFETRQLVEDVRQLLNSIEHKNQLKNCSPYYNLMLKKQELEKELEELKKKKQYS